MKIFVVTLVLLVVGAAFVAPPLIFALPGLLVGILLIASPLLAKSMTRGMDSGSAARRTGSGRDQRPSSATSVR